MKPRTLLLTAGLLATLGSQPATATPMLLTPASVVAQASISPIYIEYGDIKGVVCEPVNQAASAADAALAEGKRRADPPDPDDTESLGKEGQGTVIIGALLAKAIDENTTKDSTGKSMVDLDGFAKSTCKLLNNKNPELTRYAAIGWGISEKKAASKLSELARKGTLEAANTGVNGILIGLLRNVEANKSYAGSLQGGLLAAYQEAVDASDYQIWQRNFGSGG